LPTALLFALAAATPVSAAPAKNAQKSFASPEEALQNLVKAARSNDTKALTFILGPGSKEIISSGDPVADKNGRERFVSLYDEKVAIEDSGTGKVVFSIGNEDYPFPIPLVKKGKTWRFDTRAGKEELLNRRIGRNELAVIDIMRAYVDAQREYYSTDWDGDNSMEFAQKIRSSPGKKDGLYWDAKEGEKLSPLGPLAAKAAKEGYSKGNTAFHGYYFRILKGQGKDAEGGAFDYVVNGKMILGYAMVAYPAQFGSSGIMTFIVNQNGIVYQKNLGKDSSKVAASMKVFNPDASWKKIE
jgi:hypothetical protein